MRIIAAILAMVSYSAQADQQLTCMAQNIYNEARGERFEGMIAVGEVVMNRVRHSSYPNSVCEVVYEPKQFSWTLRDDITYDDYKAWEIALDIAHAVMSGTMSAGLGDNALHFHTTSINPSWAKNMHTIKTIGNHVFKDG